MIYDVAVIGCGIIGASVAFELSKYELSVAVFESENDVACGTTKANSAIIHAGFDAENGSLMAKLNVQGSLLTEKLCSDLSVLYKKIGSLVLGFDEKDNFKLQTLFERGMKNNVPGLELWDKNTVFKKESNLNENIVAALYAKTAAIINPWEFCIAQIETAIKNGVKLFLNSKIEKIEIENNIYNLHANYLSNCTCNSDNNPFKAKYVINCAGLYADKIHNLVSPENEFLIYPNKGEYFLLDKSQGNLVNHIIFQPPSDFGKGVLISPTVHGNLIVGPSSVDILDKTSLKTTVEGLEFVKETARRSVPCVNFSENIRNFTGLRAYSTESDFIIRPSHFAKNFINVAGIKSPGLSSAPAIAVYLREMLENLGLMLKEKAEAVSTREKIVFKELSKTEKNDCLKKESSYGRIVCRCETVTEGEIKNALRSNIPPVSLDGVKRRTCAGMGRCQGGFCSPKVLNLISEELKMPPQDVLQEGSGSYILTGMTKGSTQAI